MFSFKKRKKPYEGKIPEQVTASQIFNDYEKNLSLFKEMLKNDSTIVFHELMPEHGNIKICLVYLSGMADQKEINKNIIGPILDSSKINFYDQNVIDTLSKQIIHFGNNREISDIDTIIGSILYGDTIILAGDCPTALIIDSKGFVTRSITEPLSENVVRGPRDSFTESFMINISLIRRRINNSALKFDFQTLGKQTKTKICICYIKELANENIVKELYSRIGNIKLNAILDSGYIVDMIKDNPLSPFSTVGNTERPDKIAANLLEGKIAIIVDGTPIVITVPYLFTEYFQSSEDYYNEFIYGSINRLLRWSAFFISMSIPALYVALITFHNEMIPTPLLLSISASRTAVPFPTIVEVLLMLFVFEILREGGARLPSSIGSTISYVGAIVIGDAAVNAKFVSAPIVIVVAFTGLSVFLIPKLMGPLVIIRAVLLILAGILGLYGYLFGLIGMFIHLLSIRSFGVPYLLNISTLNKFDAKDTFIRAPWWISYFKSK